MPTSPAAELQTKLHYVGSRAARLWQCYGTSCFLSILLVTGLACGGLDYLLRPQGPAGRWIVSLTFIGVSIAAFLRFVRPVFGIVPSAQSVAQRIEARYPQLKDKLSSATSFGLDTEHGGLGGSAELQETVIAAARDELTKLDLEACLDSRVPRQAAWGTLFLLGLVAAVCYANTDVSFHAARRMLMPWRQDPWPRWNVLSFQSPPRKLAEGATFDAELIDLAGHLPDEVTIQYWFDGDSEDTVDSRPMKRVANRMVAHLSNVGKSFKFRAVGGDDQTMPWIRVDVVQPPRIEDIRVHIRPPAYSGLPSRESGTAVRTLAGSELVVTGGASKPVGELSVLLRVSGQEIPLAGQLAEDGRTFRIPAGGQRLTAVDSGTLAIGVEDLDGVAATEALQIQLEVVPDQRPTIRVSSPDEDTFAAPSAAIALQASIEDDLAIDAVTLEFRDRSLDLWSPPSRQDPPTAKVEVDYEWQLDGSLQVGETLEYRLVARDRKPQEQATAWRRIEILSAAEAQSRLQQRKAEIRQTLERALDTQRAARREITQLQQVLSEDRPWSEANRQALLAAELNQRHVKQILEDPQSGAAAQIERLARVRVAAGVADRRQLAEMARLQEALRELDRTLLAPAAETLGEVRSRVGAESLAAAERAELAAPLERAAGFQAGAVERLEQLLMSLQQQQDVQVVGSRLAELQREQRQLLGETGSSPTVGRSLRELTTAERAQLGALAGQQSRLGDALRAALQALDADAAESLQAVRDQARDSAVVGLVREAVRNIEANRLGRAADLQQRIADALGELSEQLLGPEADQTGGDSAGSMADRGPLQDSLTTLLAEQQRLAERASQVADRAEVGNANRESSERERTVGQIADRQNELRRNLQQLQANYQQQPSLAYALGGAERQMGIAVERLKLGTLDADTVAAQQSAADQLARLLQAIEADGRGEEPGGESQPGEQGEGNAAAEIDSFELRLLRLMQEDIHRRTEAIDRAGNGAAAESADVVRELAEQQAWLVQRVRELAEGEGGGVDRSRK